MSPIARSSRSALITAGLTALLAGATACGDTGAGEVSSSEPFEGHKPLLDGKADQWGPQDDPKLLGDDLEYVLDALPREGEAARVPWAGGYWPTFTDSINLPWAGEGTMSPAAKYGAAFGVEGMEDLVSKHHGVDKYGQRKECAVDDDCDVDAGEACAKRAGQAAGRCIPMWWGICHAWAPVAILEPEPVHPVERGGVRFEVNDLKALMTLLYDRTETKFVSLRCNANAEGDDFEVDAYGNPTSENGACKDTNPGTFHVVVTNLLGIRGESFVEDRTFDDEVWNQPVRGFRVLELKDVDVDEANTLAGVTPTPEVDGHEGSEAGELEPDGEVAIAPVTVAPGQAVHVSLAVAGEATLRVAFGDEAEPACESVATHAADAVCELTVPEGAEALRVWVVAGDEGALWEVETVVEAMDGGLPDAYVFNDEAERFAFVRMEFDYITESPEGVDGALADAIDQYTKTDTYEYVLELDGEGRIIGGEWVGDSKQAHPDFLWAPRARSTRPVVEGVLSYALVKGMLEESVHGPQEGVTHEVVREQGTVAAREWAHFGPFEASEGAFEAMIAGTGDADLYVRLGAQPTASAHDCRPYIDGSSESCTLSGPGSFYVSVHGYKASDFRLTTTFLTRDEDATPADGAEPVTPDAGDTLEHLDVSGTVAKGELSHHTLTVRAGQGVVIRTEAANDVDLYVRTNAAPTPSEWEHRGYTATGEESLTIVPPADAVLHIAVHGYAASDFRLTTASL